MITAVALLVLVTAGRIAGQCNPSPTTASGSKAPTTICSGDLIFNDDFWRLDHQKWSHEITLSGGGNWEFQAYGNNRTNSYVQDGNLHIQPTLTVDQYPYYDFLSTGIWNVEGATPADACTDPTSSGCVRYGTATNYLNPCKSARISTMHSFAFKYGRVEIRAKMPAGDWLWPALWMLPRYNQYGAWPASGEIDISEVRGNRNLLIDGGNIGVEQSGMTLHFGPFWQMNGAEKAMFWRNIKPGYDQDFHVYELEWTENHIRVTIDGDQVGQVTPPAGGFYELGDFANLTPNIDNPWRFAEHMAPFDEEFYIIMNVAVGGTTGFMPDVAVNVPPKPWLNGSPTANKEFWDAKDDWYPTWNEGTDDSHLQVDYVRVYAL